MSIPNFDFNPPVIAGDHKDDDAEVIDNLVESKAEPPTPEERPKAKANRLEKPKPISRLMTGTQNVDKAWASPTLLLPSDPNRKSLHVSVISATSTDIVRFSDEANKCSSLLTSGVVPVYAGGVDLSGYTGALWVHAPDAAATVTVSYLAVTA